jgi:hypothetical protein
MEYSKELRRLEERLLDPSVRRNRADVEALLAEEFREIGASGKEYDRKAIVEAMLNETSAEVELHDFCATPVAEDVVLVTFRTVKRTLGVPTGARRSSLWLRRGGRWRMYFHQGTKIEDAKA